MQGIAVAYLSNVTNYLHTIVGSAHQLVPIDKLVSTLKSQVDELKTKMMKREEELSSLFKRTSKAVAEFAEETDKMVEQLHRTRDEQVIDCSLLVSDCLYFNLLYFYLNFTVERSVTGVIH